MAPSAGVLHSLVAKNIKVLRFAIKSTTKYLQTIPAATTQAAPQAIFVRAAPRQPIHPAALLRQSRRWISSGSSGFASAIRRFGTSSSGELRYSGSKHATSRTGFAIKQSVGRAPFASTLRPNLTGGTLPRFAGGYGLGSGGAGAARYFSHTPAAPAQVVQNVSQAVRAFLLCGKKAQYDGVDPRTGEKRFKTVSEMEEKAVKKMRSVPRASPGSRIEFAVNPTITALTPLSAVAGFSASKSHKAETLQTEGLMDVLAVDFSRALRELAAVLGDLQRLATLGDLPISYQDSTLRVHFPGCDSETVGRLADELGLQRGIIIQDPDFDAFVGTEIALLFPLAPSKEPSVSSFSEKLAYVRNSPDDLLFDQPMFSNGEEIIDLSTLSDPGLGFENLDLNPGSNPWLSSPSGYETLHSSELFDSGHRHPTPLERHTPLEYQGIEGIYRFMEQYDDAVLVPRRA